MNAPTPGFFVPSVPELIDLARQKQGGISFYKLALLLDVHQSAVSNWTKGRSAPDDDLAARLADLAGLDRGFVIACFHAHRSAPNAARYELWSDIVRRLRPSGTIALAAAFVGLGALTFPGSAQAASLACLYIMSTGWRSFHRLQSRLNTHAPRGIEAPFFAFVLVTSCH